MQSTFDKFRKITLPYYDHPYCKPNGNLLNYYAHTPTLEIYDFLKRCFRMKSLLGQINAGIYTSQIERLIHTPPQDKEELNKLIDLFSTVIS